MALPASQAVLADAIANVLMFFMRSLLVDGGCFQSHRLPRSIGKALLPVPGVAMSWSLQ
jgi:hypothetical protein